MTGPPPPSSGHTAPPSAGNWDSADLLRLEPRSGNDGSLRAGWPFRDAEDIKSASYLVSCRYDNHGASGDRSNNDDDHKHEYNEDANDNIIRMMMMMTTRMMMMMRRRRRRTTTNH